MGEETANTLKVEGGAPAVSTFVHDARGQGDGAMVPTMLGDHLNRVTDYTPIVSTFSTPPIGDIREDAVASTISANTGGGGETQNPAFVLSMQTTSELNHEIAPTLNTMHTQHAVFGLNTENTAAEDAMPSLSQPSVTGGGHPAAVVFGRGGFGDWEEGGTLKQIEPYLTSDGRSIVQGALGWIWARSPLAIPLPGFRNMEQMQELVQAQQLGPLPLEAMQAIAEQVKKAGIVT